MTHPTGNVLGIGGVFIVAEDPAARADWYRRVLGLDMQNWGASAGVMLPVGALAAKPGAGGVFSFFPTSSTYLAPSTAGYMINLCVDDLDAILARAAAEGVTPLWRDDADAHGRFAHLIDPAGLKIELWEPLVPPAADSGAPADLA